MQTNTDTIRIEGGAHATAAFARRFLQPLFAAGTIVPYRGATHYAVCYGELCAYRGTTLLAVWSADIPDCATDVRPNADYRGTWSQA